MISSTTNPRIKWIRSLQSKRRKRYEEGYFILEGDRLAQEAQRAKHPVRLVLHIEDLNERQRSIVQAFAKAGAEVVLVSESVLAACSSTDTPPGLLVVVPFPEHPLSDPVSLALVIDQMNDPGNLGTLLRSALAANVDRVYLTQGTVDPFNPKSIRGGMGAQLHLPVEAIESTQIHQPLQGMEIWIAESKRGVPYHQVDWSGPIALVVGSEAHGPSLELKQLGTGRVTIPHSAQVESLNAAVAGSIILFEIARQRGD
jgi:TrmH family RNA methyltransferase